MRDEAARADDIDRLQAWAGQSGGLARDVPAGDIISDLWRDAKALLG
jgi:nitronate monooxygenase